jgi:hypothetical protein
MGSIGRGLAVDVEVDPEQGERPEEYCKDRGGDQSQALGPSGRAASRPFDLHGVRKTDSVATRGETRH